MMNLSFNPFLAKLVMCGLVYGLMALSVVGLGAR
jgi:hypothetical protein